MLLFGKARNLDSLECLACFDTLLVYVEFVQKGKVILKIQEVGVVEIDDALKNGVRVFALAGFGAGKNHERVGKGDLCRGDRLVDGVVVF